MIKEIEIRIAPDKKSCRKTILRLLAEKIKIQPEKINDFTILKRSVDARSRKARFSLLILVAVEEALPETTRYKLKLQDVTKKPEIVIVGFGPAGMFAALKAIELGYKPIVLEQGKAVRERRFDIAALNKKGIVNPESNYCFGEGGAGTFSDGKLYTRSNKRGSTKRILEILVQFGANPEILVDTHPHIGSNKLPIIVQTIRNAILESGGEIHFETKVTKLLLKDSSIKGVEIDSKKTLETKALLLATGHSARSVYNFLSEQSIELEQKPFSLGFRIEHPQTVIDKMQYRSDSRGADLPAAAYSFAVQADDRGVFSFCMCPGGIICPATTKDGELVVNGWSPSGRNSKYANSGIVTEVTEQDLEPFKDAGPLAGIELQKSIEQKAFQLGGGSQVAPAQRLKDFLEDKPSTSLPKCSYHPGVTPVNFKELFPAQIYQRLKEGLAQYVEKHPLYLDKEGVIIGVESRTSSPVRIPRDKESYMHPKTIGLFPVGEGAGFAGGIMSAAIDGENSARAACRHLKNLRDT